LSPAWRTRKRFHRAARKGEIFIAELREGEKVFHLRARPAYYRGCTNPPSDTAANRGFLPDVAQRKGKGSLRKSPGLEPLSPCTIGLKNESRRLGGTAMADSLHSIWRNCSCTSLSTRGKKKKKKKKKKKRKKKKKKKKREDFRRKGQGESTVERRSCGDAGDPHKRKRFAEDIGERNITKEKNGNELRGGN